VNEEGRAGGPPPYFGSVDVMRRSLVHLVAAVSVLLIAGVASGDTWYRHYADGQRLFDEKKYEAAKTAFMEALSASGKPNDAERARTYGMHFISPYAPNLYLGRIHLELSEENADEANRAVAYLTRSAGDLPRADTYLYLAQAHRRLGNKEEAEKACESALKIDPGHKEARALLDKLRLEEPEEVTVPPPPPGPPLCAEFAPGELPVVQIGPQYTFARPPVPSQAEPGELLVSLEDIWELFGFDIAIYWSKPEKRLEFQRDGRTLILSMDSDTAALDDKSCRIATPPRVDDGAAMAPVRLVGRCVVGCDVRVQPPT